MAKVELKKPVVQAIAEDVKDARSVVLVDHRGLTVEQDTQLRRKLREAGVDYKVRKNTMMNLAFKDTELDELCKVLEGPSALAVSKEDPTAPARILADFAKTAPVLEFKAGIVEGTYYDAEGMKIISQIPSREELLSKLLGSLQSPITNLARVLSQIAESGSSGKSEEEKEAAPVEEDKAEKAEGEAPEADSSEEDKTGDTKEAADKETEAKETEEVETEK